MAAGIDAFPFPLALHAHLRRTSGLGHVVRLHDAQPLRLNRIPWPSRRRILILLVR